MQLYQAGHIMQKVDQCNYVLRFTSPAAWRTSSYAPLTVRLIECTPLMALSDYYTGSFQETAQKDCREHCKPQSWQCWFYGSQPSWWRWKFGDQNSATLICGI